MRSVETREPKKNGSWKMVRPLNLRRSSPTSLPQADDHEILTLLLGGGRQFSCSYANLYEQVQVFFNCLRCWQRPFWSRFLVPAATSIRTTRTMRATQRCTGMRHARAIHFEDAGGGQSGLAVTGTLLPWSGSHGAGRYAFDSSRRLSFCAPHGGSAVRSLWNASYNAPIL